MVPKYHPTLHVLVEIFGGRHTPESDVNFEVFTCGPITVMGNTEPGFSFRYELQNNNKQGAQQLDSLAQLVSILTTMIPTKVKDET